MMRAYVPKFEIRRSLGQSYVVEIRFGASQLYWVLQLVSVGDDSRHVLVAPSVADVHFSRRALHVL